MRHSKQHQESGVHCDLWVQRLASWKSFENKSTAISCPQFNKYVSFSKLLNVKTKQQIVSVVAEKCQDQVIQQHLSIYVHGFIASKNAWLDEQIANARKGVFIFLFKEQYVIASARCYLLNQEHQDLPSCEF